LIAPTVTGRSSQCIDAYAAAHGAAWRVTRTYSFSSECPDMV